MTPTKPWLLVVLAILAGAIGFAAVGLWEAAFARTLPVPWMAVVTLFMLAVAIFLWTLSIRPRIARKEGTKPLNPFVAARTAALAMAASRTGALAAGFYLGVAAALSMQIASPVVSERIWMSLSAAVSATLVVLAALWMEYVCRLPEDDDDDEPSSGRPADAGDWVLPSNGAHDRRSS